MKLSNSQTICLNMIVKNEKKVIKRCLSSLKAYIDYWVIVDTGSTDGTQDLIRDFLNDIPGELIERPWVDFGHNRSEALQYAKGKADYAFIIDADELIAVEEDFAWPKLTHDSYLIQIDDNGLVYNRCQIINNHLNWYYKGVLHEYIECQEAKSQGFLSNFRTVRLLDGARSSDPLKFKKDALVLEMGLLSEPDNERYVFYLAQSYRDAGEMDLAIRYYEQRVGMEGWDQEVWYSLYQIALLKDRRGDSWSTVMEYLFKAYEFRPSRPEPLYKVMQHYMSRKEFHLAHLIGKQAASIPFPSDILFVEKIVCQFLILFDYAVCAYYAGRNEEAIEANNRLLIQKDLPAELFLRAIENRKFSLDLMYTKKHPQRSDTNRIVICIPFRNPGHWLDNMVESLTNQNHDTFHAHFIDNASTDNSHLSIPINDNRFTIGRSDRERKQDDIICEFLSAHVEEQDICLVLDGHNWLASNDTIAFINKYFNEYDCDVLYGQYRLSSGQLGNSFPLSGNSFPLTIVEIVKNSLISFRGNTFLNLPENDIRVEGLVQSMLKSTGIHKTHFNDEVLSVCNLSTH